MKISINHELCTSPRDCRICLDRCQEKVFGIYPQGRRAAGVRAHDWAIVPMLISRCTNCQDCLNFCPPQAISLS